MSHIQCPTSLRYARGSGGGSGDGDAVAASQDGPLRSCGPPDIRGAGSTLPRWFPVTPLQALPVVLH